MIIMIFRLVSPRARRRGRKSGANVMCVSMMSHFYISLLRASVLFARLSWLCHFAAPPLTAVCAVHALRSFASVRRHFSLDGAATREHLELNFIDVSQQCTHFANRRRTDAARHGKRRASSGDRNEMSAKLFRRKLKANSE